VADPDEAGQPGLLVTMRKGWPEFRGQTSPRAAPQWCAAANFTRPLAQDRWGMFCKTAPRAAPQCAGRLRLGQCVATADEKRSPCQLWPDGRQY
jgi:hypothetical protein